MTGWTGHEEWMRDAESIAAQSAEPVAEMDEDVHQCRSCDHLNDTHSIGCPMHPDYDPALT